jgi:hypothetical protein
VLEIGSVNFGLQGEAEQEAVTAGFAACLNSLTFPVQIVVRVLPIDIGGYLAYLDQRTRHRSPDLIDLAHDYSTFLQRLARNRTLLERRFYLVVPAHLEATPGGWRLFARRQHSGSIESARRQLTFRCEEIERLLGRCGLSVRRLSAGELAQLFSACWCAELAHSQRLTQPPTTVDAPVVTAFRYGHRRA